MARKADKDKNGKMTLKEVKSLLKLMNTSVSDEYVEELFQVCFVVIYAAGGLLPFVIRREGIEVPMNSLLLHHKVHLQTTLKQSWSFEFRNCFRCTKAYFF